MLDEKDWFTEVVDTAGSAFSLRIRRKLHEERSPYQSIAVYETEHFGNLLVIDGFTIR
jgi:spermidine synthase